MIARGGVFGDRIIDLRLLDIEPAKGKLDAVGMELQDVASPYVLRCTCTTDAREAFMDLDVALLVGARPRGPGMLRKDLLAANAGIFKAQGAVLDEVASRDCKVVVVGNPANTNALLCMRSAPSLPKRNFTALTRLDQNRTAGMLAAKIGERKHTPGARRWLFAGPFLRLFRVRSLLPLERASQASPSH